MEHSFNGSISFQSEHVFTQSKGSRRISKKILIVITDGESNDLLDLDNAVNGADAKGIVRFTIGVRDF